MPFRWSLGKPEESEYSSLKEDETSDSEAGLKRTIRGKRLPFPRWVSVFLFINATLLGLLIVINIGTLSNHRPRKLLESPLPDFPHHIKTFALDPLYLSLPSEESNKAWERLAGPNPHAAIHLENAESFHYPEERAGLSMFHQLHCLSALRNFIFDLTYDRLDREKLLRDWPANVTEPSEDSALWGLWHAAHCLDYLRQAIQCSADTSLEFIKRNPNVNNIIDGFDWPHECKSWDAIWDYAEAHYTT